MDFFDALAREVTNPHPGVWISRMVLYSKILPEPEDIQDIRFQRGFNIIWAEESEDDGPEREITGHSAGKTTCCRLIRYLLGENFPPHNKNIRQIREVFPQGYVAGELHIRNDLEDRITQWAVIRPIGKNRNSYILENANIETLIKNRTNQVTQETYSRKLGLDDLMNRMGTGTIVRTDEPIQWGHLLSWCTRDQENRFQNIHEWRSPRSEHGAPSFKFPKDGPLFVMRAALGLFLPDELKGEEDLAILYKKKGDLEKKLEPLRQEPQFRMNFYKKAIKDHIEKMLRKKIPNDLKHFESQPMVYSDTLEAYVNEAIKKTEAELKSTSEKVEQLQDEMDGLGVEIRQVDHQLADLGVEFSKKSQISKELAAGVNLKKKEMESVLYDRCAAYICHNECSTFLKEFELVRFNDKIDDRFNKQKIKENHLEIDRLKDEQQRLEDLKSTVVEQHAEVKKERAKHALLKQDYQRILTDLQNHWKNFVHWDQIVRGIVPHSDLNSVTDQIANYEKRILTEENRLSELIQSHDTNRSRLSGIFSHCVKSVLASGIYGGKCSLDKRDLSFHITHGPAMRGEAIETLSVLLTDISCMIFNAVSITSALPGFLLHDSPREADLGLGIYKSFIRFVEKLHTVFGGQAQCPFQYILTTTTSPPIELRGPERVKLRLDASSEKGLLLKKYIFPQDETMVQNEYEYNL